MPSTNSNGNQSTDTQQKSIDRFPVKRAINVKWAES